MSHNAAAVMASPPISAEARGAVRELARGLENTAGRMAAGLARLPPRTLNTWEWKGLRGRERAIAKIRSVLPIEPEIAIATRAVWRWVEAVEELPTDDSPPRDGFVILAVLAGLSKGRQVRVETFGCCFTTFSICRLLDRSGFKANPVATMMAAHAALTELDQVNGTRVFDLAAAQLPTATGAFLGTPARFGPDRAPLMTCRTWIPADQMFEDQAGTLTAWRTLISQPGGTA